MNTYDPTPHYAPIGSPVLRGWHVLAAFARGRRVIAVDGPAIAPWERLVEHLCSELTPDGVQVRIEHAVYGMLSWNRILELTTTPALGSDADFEALPSIRLADLFDRPVAAADGDFVTFIIGPGAALSEHDELWYLDLPKRYAESAVCGAGPAAGGHGPARHVGQRDRTAPVTTKRLFYTDWPLLDAHRDTIAAKIAWWIDGQDPSNPAILAGQTLHATLADLAARPFRTRPTFNTTSWGGQWAKQTLGLGAEQPNTALGYELIAPESGLLIGEPDRAAVEVPLGLLVSCLPREVLGEEVHQTFGSCFPIRFDYLDTVAGGNLSVHCHPRPAYMREVFGWPFTQHETYYMMRAQPDSTVFLGLRDDADIEAFHRQAKRADEKGTSIEITEHVQAHPAIEHQLYLIPAGTPHGSGEGNVVLEISATPYLYSLRFYDWQRRDPAGRQRAVHVEHAFRNLDPRRRSSKQGRTSLIPVARLVNQGDGWVEQVLGEHPEMFFDVRRLEIEPGRQVPGETKERFHVLNVVSGTGVSVEWRGESLALAYAETLVIPAACGSYTLTACADQPVRVVKAFVRSLSS